MGSRIIYTGRTKRNAWECFSWKLLVKSNKSTIEIEYFTGLGHSTKAVGYWGLKTKNLTKKVIKEGELYIHVPKLKDILYCIALDAKLGQLTFEDFCYDLGYDTDSRKALDIYMGCQQSESKLRQIMKSKNYLYRILAWEL
jgi:hypothetical protein